LWASNFKNPSGYGFAGWSSTANYVDSTKTKYYGPNETLSPTELASIAALDGYTLDSGGVTLYANWIPASTEYTMQTFNASACSSLASDGTGIIALRDTRDNNTYTVAKLADGKCWMIENLRLDNTATLSPANTNIASDWTKLTNSINQSTGAIESESNHLTAPSTSGDYWCTTADSANCYNQSRLASQNVTDPASSMNTANSNVYSYGNYYNWYSATAGYGVQEDGTRNADESYSLCPNSWRLPSGGHAYAAGTTTTSVINRNVGVDRTSSGTYIGFSDFYNLGYVLMNSNLTNGTTAYMSNANNGYSYYGTNTTSTNTNNKFNGKIGMAVFRSWPNNFLFSGRQNGAATYHRGAYGLYWSSTALSTQSAYDLSLGTSNVYPGTASDYKYYGYSVRCLINP
ncbi:hypothetical protein IKE79_00135, partial [Candidatus Saccharibacteria bacterium]|nr:hypothetical protein [Candidatus Saccharibacteria bacterium]